LPGAPASPVPSQAVPIVLASASVVCRRVSNRSCAKLMVSASVKGMSPSMPVINVDTPAASLAGGGRLARRRRPTWNPNSKATAKSTSTNNPKAPTPRSMTSFKRRTIIGVIRQGWAASDQR